MIEIPQIEHPVIVADFEASPEVVNSLQAYAGQTAIDRLRGVELSQTTTLRVNNRGYMISNDWALLSYCYVQHGIIQTLIDQPVDDAFRSGFEIKTGQLDADEIEQLEVYIEENRVIEAVMQAMKWARLYGGGAVLVITDQPNSAKFDINKLRPDSPLEFRGTDMWELFSQTIPNPGSWEYNQVQGNIPTTGFVYYGVPVDATRVMRVTGKQAPAFIRPQLRGWGMSEVERLVRSLNQYMKNQDVIFELLDEAKIDVYRIKGFNTALLQKNGTEAQIKRAQTVNMLKNFQNAIVMDLGDEYEQKQVSFTGLAEVLVQIRQGIAADLKMPVTKLFGISATGFNSGEDDIENYNSMIEGEIRSKCKHIVTNVLRISCQHLFGFVPDDLKIIFNPLRILSAKEEEEVKDKKFKRIMEARDKGLATDKEAKEAINKASLLPIELDETTDGLPPPGQQSVTPDGDPQDGA